MNEHFMVLVFMVVSGVFLYGLFDLCAEIVGLLM